jgi:hypothetical protein
MRDRSHEVAEVWEALHHAREETGDKLRRVEEVIRRFRKSHPGTSSSSRQGSVAKGRQGYPGNQH